MLWRSKGIRGHGIHMPSAAFYGPLWRTSDSTVIQALQGLLEQELLADRLRVCEWTALLILPTTAS